MKFKISYLIYVFLFIFLIKLQVRAETISITTLHLTDVINIIKNKNPTLLSTEEKKQEIIESRKLVKSTLLPTVTWSLNANVQKDALYKNSALYNGNSYNFYSSDLKVTQPLYVYGSLSAVKLAEQQEKIQSLNKEMAERDLSIQAMDAFYRLILWQHNKENLLKIKNIISTSLDTANNRMKIGRGQLIDVLQIKTQESLILSQIDQANSLIDVAFRELGFYMGTELNESIKIVGDLPKIDSNKIREIINLNNVHLPEYEINQLNISSMAYSRDTVMGKHYPTLKLVGDYYYNNFTKSDLFTDPSNSWAISLQLSIPLFSGFSSSFDRQISYSQEAQLYRAKENLENSLKYNQSSALFNLQSSESSIKALENAVVNAELSQKEAAKNYKLSTIDFLQFLSVQQAFLTAVTNLETVKYQNIILNAKYFSSTGQSLDKLIETLEATK